MGLFDEEIQNKENESSLSRRNFVKGGLAAGALALGGAALAGCASPEASSGTSAGSSAASGSSAAATSGDLDEITARLVERIPGADLPDARPIPPVEPPASWDEETDVVVVGTGGGIVATAYLAQQGLRVIAVEKDAIVGGASRHACTFANVYGGSKDQNEMEFAVPTYPPDVHAFMRLYEQECAYSINEPYLKNMLELSGPACDWIMEQDDVNMVCHGPIWHDIDVAEGKQNVVLGMNNPTNAIEAVALKEGADIRVMTSCEKLVSDGDRVVGIVANGSDGKEIYIKAEKGVILCAGGFGMNRDLIKAYLPSAYEGTVQGGPMPFHTGEAFRMGLGLGADFAGYDSWSCWEGAIDEETAGGDGEFWHYFWHGERQLFHNPWLIIDKRGERQPYFAQTQELFANPGGQMGDLSNCAAWMSALGHKVYSICDSTFPETIFDNNVLTPTQSDRNRIPLTDPNVLIDTGGLVSTDWLAEVDEAVERGAVKKADTIEELAEMLLLDPDVLVKAVEDYNKLCEKGVDDEMSTPYDPTWLNPILEPPFYAAIVGGQMAKTMCGLRTDANLQVMREDGSLIPGLYANATTAGGLSGEANYGCFWNSTVFGGVGTSWITGWIAAECLINNEK